MIRNYDQFRGKILLLI